MEEALDPLVVVDEPDEVLEAEPVDEEPVEDAVDEPDDALEEAAPPVRANCTL